MNAPIILTKAERKMLAELNASSLHLLVIITSNLIQWWMGLQGGGVFEGTKFYPLEVKRPSEKKYLLDQLGKIQRHCESCLAELGIKGNMRIRQNIQDSANAKVSIIVHKVVEVLPDLSRFSEILTLQTYIIHQALEDCLAIDRHKSQSWRWLRQTFGTLVSRTTTPEIEEMGKRLYADMKDVLIGMEVIEDAKKRLLR